MHKIGRSHKTFLNTVPFPSSKTKRTKSQLLDKLEKRTDKLEKLFAVGEANAKHSKYGHVTLLSEADACCLRKRYCKIVLEGNFDDRLSLRYFSNNISAPVFNEISPQVSLVKPSHLTKSNYMFYSHYRI